ncbi:Magnesium transport protein CorA [Serratia marcescens]|uniref:Magnesium transport protein CorA n=1 Tax=Serratia marcescens TaxID=615 RepID=A0A379Y829_SERMA|nr:Magnesium transport protein CorA [Serratia marcescens]
MLSAFKLDNRRLSRLELDDSDDLTSSLWVDLVEPEEGERERVQNELGQSLATRPELDDIEASARFFEDEDGLHIHSFFYFEDAEDHAGNSTVAFTIRDGRLYTLRERELPAFRLYRMRARNQTMLEGNAYELLLDLFETKIEQLADEIENIYSDLEQLSRVIMEGHQGGRIRRRAVDAGGAGRYRLEGAFVSDGYPARAQLLGAQGAFADRPTGAGA